MVELVYQALFEGNLYYSFRMPKELGAYHWVIDAKDRVKVTAWEDWWATIILALMEAKTISHPLRRFKGGDYSAQERFRSTLSEYKREAYGAPGHGEYFSLNLVLKEDFRFSSAPEFGLEAADILVNAIRRSLAGSFGRQGWLPIRELMVHRTEHYIRLISMAPDDGKPRSVPYKAVLADFSTGGKLMLPRWALVDKEE